MCAALARTRAAKASRASRQQPTAHSFVVARSWLNTAACQAHRRAHMQGLGAPNVLLVFAARLAVWDRRVVMECRCAVRQEPSAVLGKCAAQQELCARRAAPLRNNASASQPTRLNVMQACAHPALETGRTAAPPGHLGIWEAHAVERTRLAALRAGGPRVIREAERRGIQQPACKCGGRVFVCLFRTQSRGQ